MDENTPDEDRRIVQEIAGRFDAPSFMRRAKLVETSWNNLVEQLALLRRKKLEMVALRLGQLHALAGSWDSLRERLASEEDLLELQRLHAELKPQLRLPLTATTSSHKHFAAMRRLIEAMEGFNRRWPRVLVKVDLTRVNEIREAYNRYYLLERECALGSARAGRDGFQRLEPIGLEDLHRHFPPLLLPSIVGS
jgi:hypothetical protein